MSGPCHRTTPDNSGQLQTTPDNSRQLQTTPDNSGQLRTTPDDFNSGQLRTTPDNFGQLRMTSTPTPGRTSGSHFAGVGIGLTILGVGRRSCGCAPESTLQPVRYPGICSTPAAFLIIPPLLDPLIPLDNVKRVHWPLKPTLTTHIRGWGLAVVTYSRCCGVCEFTHLSTTHLHAN